MTDKQRNENKISIPPGWSISPSTLKMLQETANTLKSHNEMIQRSLQGPMNDWASFAEAQKKQREEMEAVIKAINIPKLNLEWINESALAFQRAIGKPIYLSPTVMTVYRKPETPSQLVDEDAVTQRETNRLLRQLVEEQRRSNQIQEEASKKQARRKTKEKSRVIVLNQMGHLFIRNRPKRSLDLGKSNQKRKIVAALTSHFISTKELFAASDCSSMDVFYKAIQDLKVDAKQMLGLKSDFITNDRKQGYCIANGYTFIVEKRN
ncbi:MAG: hypothetical protein ABII13_00800 [Patescibacteria group bacterium]